MDTDISEEYTKLENLYQSGFITEYEFNRRKKELLGDAEPPKPTTTTTINEDNNNSYNSYSSSTYDNGYNYNNNTYNNNDSVNNDYNTNYNYNNSSSNNYDYYSNNNISSSNNNSYDYNNNNNNNYSNNSNSSSSYDYNNNIPVYDYNSSYNNNDNYNNNVDIYNSTSIPTNTSSYNSYNSYNNHDNNNNNNYNSYNSYTYNNNNDADILRPPPYVEDNRESDPEPEPEPEPVPIRSLPTTSTSQQQSKIVKDKLTGKSETIQKIQYPYKVKDNYMVYDKEIDGVILYYKSKECSYQTDIIPFETLTLSTLDDIVHSQFGLRSYIIKKIILKHRKVDSDPSSWYQSNVSECTTEQVDTIKCKGHYLIEQSGFTLHRNAGTMFVKGEHQTVYSRDFIIPQTSYKIGTRTIALEYPETPNGGWEPFYFKILGNPLTFRPIRDYKAPKFVPAGSKFKLLNFLNLIRNVQVYQSDNDNEKKNGWQELPTKSLYKSNDLNISKTLNDCIVNQKCFKCGSYTMTNSFFCTSHHDKVLIDMYHEVKDLLKKSDNDEKQPDENAQSESNRVVKDDPTNINNREKFCYLPDISVLSKAFESRKTSLGSALSYHNTLDPYYHENVIPSSINKEFRVKLKY